MGLISMLSLVIMQVTSNTTKLKRRVETRSEISLYEYQVSQALALVNNCNINFTIGKEPKLKDEKKIYRSIIRNGVEVEIALIDIEKEKLKNGIIIKKISLLLSELDSKIIEEAKEKYASKNLHGYAELELEFGKNNVGTKKYKKIITRKIPVFLNLDHEAKFQSCYASAFSEQLKNSIAIAIEKSCGYGMYYNGDKANPECIPVADEFDMAKCPEGQFIQQIKVIGVNEKVNYISKCVPELCQENEVGIWHNNKMSCVKCESSELPIITNSGLMCQNLECEGSHSKVEYFAGIDSRDGSKKCRTLVELKDSSCGENGFKLISTSDSGSVSSECCKSCPEERDNICEGNSVTITDDCGVNCQGKLPRKNMEYDDWGVCTPRPGVNTCFQKRAGKCNSLDSKGYPCCHSGKNVEITQRQCFSGTWEFGDCPEDTLDIITTIEPFCNGGCCDPVKKPSSRQCVPETFNGKTILECQSIYGRLYRYKQAVYCKVKGACPYSFSSGFPFGLSSQSWKKAYAKHYSISGKGSASNWCDPETCFAEEKAEWHNGDAPKCSFHNFKKYTRGKCRGRDYRTLRGKVSYSLCY